MTTGNSEVANNRNLFLNALRSGKYAKGPFVAGQDKPPPGASGFCAVGLPYTLLLHNKGPVQGLRKVLGVTSKDLWTIQNEWNDSDLTFPQIADLIEHCIFSRGCSGGGVALAAGFAPIVEGE
jgi:hypothetical protein